MERADQILYKAWINEVLSKDEYSGKISTFKRDLSDNVTTKAKEVCEGEWRGSYPERTLNALRHHIGGEEFPYKWGNDIFSSLAALIISGDDWKKQLQFMQEKEMTDYRIAFSMYGTINGFANLPRDFTDVLFNRDSKYIADVYQEFYGQLFGRGVIKSNKESNTEKDTKPQPVYEDVPKETCSYTATSDKTSCEVTNVKNNDIESILKDIRYGKKERSLGEKTILSIIKIYNDFGKHPTLDFYNEIRKIRNVGEEAIKTLKNTIGIETTDDGLFSQNGAEQTDTMTNDTAVSFVSDKTLPDIVKQMNIQDGSIVKILIDDIEYIQNYHKHDFPVKNANCIEHLNNLIYSIKKKGTSLQRTPENEKITNELINRLKQRFINND